ncbi:UNVERIFIED_CONTAM: hypothetical protein GTU68_045084 [Idotea baltica]|nr:hypothetical protein [Idotea baltica]
MKAQIGGEPAVGEWFELSQERINDFADATLDHQFIHIDPERAAQTPFGGPIAHGFLTLSMLVHLSGTIPNDLPPLEGMMMGVNYGMKQGSVLSQAGSLPLGSRDPSTRNSYRCPLSRATPSTQVRNMTVGDRRLRQQQLIASGSPFRLRLGEYIRHDNTPAKDA